MMHIHRPAPRDLKALMLGIGLALFLCLPAASFADEPRVSARLSSPEAGTEDVVELSVTIEGASDNVDVPRLPDIQGMRLMGGPFSSTSISMVNFNVTRSATYTWRLNPTTVGEIAIPSFQVRIGNKIYPTQALTLKAVQGSVRPRQQQQRPSSPFDNFFDQQREPAVAPAQADIKVVAVPDKTTAYVGEPVTLTYEILTQVQVTGLGMDKTPAYTGFWTESVDMPRQPQGRTVEMNGKRYQAFDVRKDLLFAADPGDKIIEEADFRVQAVVQNRDFFGFGRPQELVRKTAPVTLHILPLPVEGRPPGYTGAVGEFAVAAVTDKVETEEGEAFALRFTIKGKGNLKTLSAPVLPTLPDCKVYDPKVEEKISVQNGELAGAKTWEWIVVPQSRQLLKIPSIAYPAFDPRKKAYAVLSAPGISVFVKPGKGTGTAPVVIGGGEDVKTLGSDIAFIATDEAPLRAAASPLYARWWFFALLILPLAGNLSLLVVLKQRERMMASGAAVRARKAKGKAGRRLAGAEKALKAGDTDAFHKEVRGSIVGLVADHAGRSEEGLTLEEMESLLKLKGADGETLDRLRRLLQACDMARYASSAESGASRAALLKEARMLLETLEDLR
jgi:hypothetical protein